MVTNPAKETVIRVLFCFCHLSQQTSVFILHTSEIIWLCAHVRVLFLLSHEPIMFLLCSFLFCKYNSIYSMYLYFRQLVPLVFWLFPGRMVWTFRHMRLVDIFLLSQYLQMGLLVRHIYKLSLWDCQGVFQCGCNNLQFYNQGTRGSVVLQALQRRILFFLNSLLIMVNDCYHISILMCISLVIIIEYFHISWPPVYNLLRNVPDFLLCLLSLYW